MCLSSLFVLQYLTNDEIPDTLALAVCALVGQVNPPAKEIDTAQSTRHKTQPAHPQNQPQSPMSVEEPKKPDIQPQQTPSATKCQLTTKDCADSTFWTLLINVALTLITLGIAIAGIIQALAAKRTANALIIQNRPWLLVEKIEKPYLIPATAAPIGAQKFSYCFLKMKNFGHTPAKVTAMLIELQIGDNPTKPPAECVAKTAPEIYVFPHGETRQF